MNRTRISCTILPALFICAAVNAQTQEVQQLVLNYAKLQQLEKILENMYRGYRILANGYSTIKNIAEGNFKLHDAFMEGLLKVSGPVKNYKRIAEIISYQRFIVRCFRTAHQRYAHDNNLTVSELDYISKVNNRLLQETLEDLEELTLVITSSSLRMNDFQRLEVIDRLHRAMEQKVAFVKNFNSVILQVSTQRKTDRENIRTIEKLHNLD